MSKINHCSLVGLSSPRSNSNTWKGIALQYALTGSWAPLTTCCCDVGACLCETNSSRKLHWSVSAFCQLPAAGKDAMFGRRVHGIASCLFIMSCVQTYPTNIPLKNCLELTHGVCGAFLWRHQVSELLLGGGRGEGGGGLWHLIVRIGDQLDQEPAISPGRQTCTHQP